MPGEKDNTLETQLAVMKQEEHIVQPTVVAMNNFILIAVKEPPRPIVLMVSNSISA